MSLALQADPGLLGNPAQSIHNRVVAAEPENLPEGQRLRDRQVPRFVEGELRLFLECGILAYGLVEGALCRSHENPCQKGKDFSAPRNDGRGRYRHRDRNRSRNRYRKQCMIRRLRVDAGSAMMPTSIPIAIAIPMPIAPCVRPPRRACQSHAFQEWSLAWLRPSAAL
ncbi:MAG: hypothetical protein H6Q05_1087 [Acidobacteria bacterium]|nr:hypothetical protein [Acidobacteriota bacterium]